MKIDPVALVVGLLLIDLVQAPSATKWQCYVKPVEPCFTHHARLSSKNGIGMNLWLIGTTRIVQVHYSDEPAFLETYLDMTSPDHSYIYGDFEICPLEHDRPGEIRSVCVTRGEKLVAEPLRGERPPFRLLDTWPGRRR